jgi:hypothetical protein
MTLVEGPIRDSGGATAGLTRRRVRARSDFDRAITSGLVQRDRPPDRFAAAAGRLSHMSSGPV